MDDPVLNCILAVCCPPEKAEAAFAQWLQHDLGPVDPSIPDWPVTQDQAQMVAAWVFKHFDLAEKGTLQPLKDSIAKLARS